MITTYEAAAEVLRAAGLDDGERLLDALDHPDMATGFHDHRAAMCYGPSPHQDRAAARLRQQTHPSLGLTQTTTFDWATGEATYS